MAKKKASPFTEPQLRSSRIRRNAGTWNPLVDTTDIFCGNRSVDRQDNYDLYDGAIGVELRVELASRSEPLLEGTEPWEQGSVSPLFIWKADNQFKMLYSARFGTCLATSDDAFEWRRPVLNEVEYEGSTENNLLGDGIEGCTGVFIDPYCAPEERFKAMGGDMAWYDPATLEPLDGDEAPEALRCPGIRGRQLYRTEGGDLGPHAGLDVGRRAPLDPYAGDAGQPAG